MSVLNRYFPEMLLVPQKTLYFKGAVSLLGKESFQIGPRGLIVHGHSLAIGGRKEKIMEQFSRHSNVEFFCRPGGEPTLDEVECIIEKARSLDAQWIAGIGGGSVLDAAKASAGLFNAVEKPLFYQEAGELREKGIPFIAVPTTAGTGSEATPNSVIINREKRNKLSIRDNSFLAKVVILDVELLKGVPKTVISFAGMDAFVQGYESFISKNATWFSETIALKAIELIDRNIVPAFLSGTEENLNALLLGSYLAGIAFSSSRLGVIHGLAHPLGAVYNIPHGLICALCFIPAVKLNKDVVSHKYDVLCTVLGKDVIRRVEEICQTLRIVSAFKDIKLIEKEKIISETLSSGSTAANPKKIVREDVEFMLREIF